MTKRKPSDKERMDFIENYAGKRIWWFAPVSSPAKPFIVSKSETECVIGKSFATFREAVDHMIATTKRKAGK
jgi:hypothetical protein